MYDPDPVYPDDSEEIDLMLDDLRDAWDDLSDWEQDFTDGMITRRNDDACWQEGLSTRQKDMLLAIHAARCTE